MPIQIPDFESEFIKAIRRNLKEVLSQLDAEDKGLGQKIQTFASRFGLTISEVEKKIKNDETFRAVFAKDPGKQKIHENIAASFIKKISKVKKFRQLSH